MAEGVGYLSIAALGKETTVNTAVNATQRLRNLEFSPDSEYQSLLDESLQGQIGRVTPELGVVDIRGAWRCYDTYTLANLLLEHFFGTLTAGAYTFDNSLVGKALTWAIEKTVSVWELSGVKINQLVLTWGADGVFLSGTLIAQNIVYTGAQNTSAELAALLPNVARRMKIAPDLNVRLGVATAALGTPEEILAPEGTLTLTRPMAETHQNGTRAIVEPSPDNFLEGTVELTLTRYTTNQYQTWKSTNQRLSMRLFFDEENGAGTQEWIIPNLVLTATPSPVNGPGFIPLTLSGMLAIGENKHGPATVISADTTDDSFNTTAADFPMLYAGAKLYVAGFVSAGNLGEFTVVSRTASKIVVSANLTTEIAGPSVTIVSRNPFARVVEV